MQDDWGLGRMAKKSREESIEEMEHADKLIERILFLEGHPNLQKLGTIRTGQTPKEMLEADLVIEHEARELYTEARNYCREAQDYVSMGIFETLLEDEEGHIDFLETQLDLHERLGAESYAQLNATPMDEAE